MQLKALILAAVATVVAAAPSAEAEGKHGCEPGTYDCREHGEPGWRVCDTNGKWRLGGLCPPKTDCFWSEENDVPYCIPAHHFDWP